MRKSHHAAQFGSVLAIGLTCFVFFAVATAVAQVPLTEQAGFTYDFVEIRSDGSGGIGVQFSDTGGNENGVVLSETYTISPPPPLQTTLEHLEVFSNASATPIWASAISPGANLNPEEGENVGGRGRVQAGRQYRKESQDASMSFTISELMVSAFGPTNHPTNNIGMSTFIQFNMTFFENFGPGDVPSQTFETKTELTGRPNGYELTPGALNVGVTNGGLDQEFVEVSLNSPFTGVIDLSGVPVGEEFVVVYGVQAEAIDTIQFDTRIEAYGRDPLDAGTGLTVSFNDLTPVGPFIPEPSTLTVLAGGTYWLVSRRRRAT